MDDKQITRIYSAIFALFTIIVLERISNSLSELVRVGFLPSGNVLILATGIAIFIAKTVMMSVVVYIIWTRDSRKRESGE